MHENYDNGSWITIHSRSIHFDINECNDSNTNNDGDTNDENDCCKINTMVYDPICMSAPCLKYIFVKSHIKSNTHPILVECFVGPVNNDEKK